MGEELYHASRTGRVDDIIRILNNNVHPDSFMAVDGSTALIMACRAGSIDSVIRLMDKGADTRKTTEDGSSIIHHTIAGSRQSPEIDSRIAILNLFLNRGFDINSKNEDHVTPFDLLTDHENMEFEILRKFLIDCGAKRGTFDNEVSEKLPSQKWGYGCFDC